MGSSRKPPRRKVKSATPVRPGRPTPPEAPLPPTRSWRRLPVWVVPLIAVVGAISLGIALGIRSSRADEPPIAATTRTEPTAPSTTPTRTVPRPARTLFADACSTCHTLAAAGSTGGIGPNLDEVKPPRDRVLAMIRNGSLTGLMPARLLEGEEAERVAAYVAANAGR